MVRTTVCPWQSGHILNMNLRKLLHSPQRLLGTYVASGMTVLDIGCGMGYFTIPLAEMVCPKGCVIAVDIQKEMLAGMMDYAKKVGVQKSIYAHRCNEHTLGLEQYNGTVNFALAFMMVHEVPNQERLMRELYTALRNGGLLLFAEPNFHVRKAAFEKSLLGFTEQGFKIADAPKIHMCRAALLKKE